MGIIKDYKNKYTRVGIILDLYFVNRYRQFM
jgi:hypothetical protein